MTERIPPWGKALVAEGHGARRSTYLLRDAVMTASGIDPNEEPQLAGTLESFVSGLLGRTSLEDPPTGILGRARSYVQQMPECRFVLTQLLPLLCSLGGDPLRRGVSASETETLLVNLEDQATKLGPRLQRPQGRLESPDELASWVGAPCAVLGQGVIPLEPIARPMDSEPHVWLQGGCYRFALEKSRTHHSFATAVHRAASAHADRALRSDADLRGMAAQFTRETTSLLARYRPENRPSYSVLFRDLDHELQHSDGSWVLVRGPVSRGHRKGSLCLGLHIRGRSRKHWLAVPPHVSGDTDDFWVRRGQPTRGGICVGRREQYRHLLSRRFFTDPEALLHWLDAGCIIATDRSAFHSSVLEERAGAPRRRLARRGVAVT